MVRNDIRVIPTAVFFFTIPRFLIGYPFPLLVSMELRKILLLFFLDLLLSVPSLMSSVLSAPQWGVLPQNVSATAG